MKMHDELKNRLRRSADALPVADPEVGSLARRGRRRRTRNRALGATGGVVLIAGVLIPLWLLLGIATGSDAASKGARQPLSGGEAGGPPVPGPTSSPEPSPTAGASGAVSAQHLLGGAQCLEGLTDPQRSVAVVGSADALSQCADFWRQGGFTAEGSPSDGAVPPLVQCVRDGRIIVIPGSGSTFCPDNGMSDVPSDLPEVEARWSNVIDLLRSIESSESHCLDEATFARRLQDVLDANDFADWKVVDDFRDGYEQRPCAAPAIHYDTLEILLVNDTWS